MRRSPVKFGAMCAAMLLSSMAYAQEPPTPTQPGQVPTPAPAQTRHAPTPATWTLFLVTVPYNGPWTISAVAAFNTQDTAHSECLHSIDVLNKIPGIHEETIDAKKAEGSSEYLICLPGSSGSQQHSGGGGSDDHSGGGG
jgi:hypothetical protein